MLRIGARGSKLSTAQVKIVQAKLKNQFSMESEFIPITSHGDVNVSIPINKVVQEGAFTSTLETALLNDEVDIAVHSFKDLPTTNPDELAIVAVLARHNPADVLIIHKDNIVYDNDTTFSFTKGTRIGTGSARRQSQLLHYYSDLSTVDIRGNVETRLHKLEKKQYDGIVLAAAVFQRIELTVPENFLKIELDLKKFPTAPAQGAICIQMKKNHPLFDQISQLNDDKTRFAVESERKILQKIGGGCQLPLGVTISQSEKFYYGSLTLAPEDWREYNTIPLTKISMKEKNREKLLAEIIELLPKTLEQKENSLQNKEIIFFGNSSTIAKYDNQVSAHGAITTVIDVQEITTNLSNELYEKSSEAWLQADWIVITSKNALHALNIFNKHYPKKNLKIASIGFSTTKLLQRAGYAVHYQALKSSSDSLAEGLMTIITKDEKLLYLSANNAKKNLQQSFSTNGFSFTQIEVYSSVAKESLPSIPSKYLADYVVVFSSEYAKKAVEKYGKDLGKKWISIGPSTSKTLEELGITNYQELKHVSVEDLIEVLQ